MRQNPVVNKAAGPQGQRGKLACFHYTIEFEGYEICNLKSFDQADQRRDQFSFQYATRMLGQLPLCHSVINVRHNGHCMPYIMFVEVDRPG